MQKGLRVDFFAVVPGRAEKGFSANFPEILKYVFRVGNLTTSVGRGTCIVLCIVLCTVLCTVFCTAGSISVLRGTISVLWG
jgi:hypothetical protein